MRAVVQRVMKASVSVGDDLVSSIGRGICVLIGISRDDTKKDMEYMVRKVLNLRVFEDHQGKRWNKSVMDHNLEVLCVSQFTLYCTMKGNKPDYHLAMGGDQCQIFYNQFLEELKKAYKPDKIKDGQFGAYMQVSIQNDGPVTIQLESAVQERKGDTARGNASQGQQGGKGQKNQQKTEELTAADSAPELTQQTEEKLNVS